MADRAKILVAAAIAVMVLAVTNCAARETEARYQFELGCFKAGGEMSRWTQQCIPSGKARA